MKRFIRNPIDISFLLTQYCKKSHF